MMKTAIASPVTNVSSRKKTLIILLVALPPLANGSHVIVVYGDLSSGWEKIKFQLILK
jgi:hypothetical protein